MEMRFEKLRVMQDVMELIDYVYGFASLFPDHERFGLRSQIQRAVTSIYLNVAEGSARRSYKDFARFITQAMGSLTEVKAAANIALHQKYISQDIFDALTPRIHSIWMSLSALRESQLKQVSS